ncbi:Protein SHORT INTERNODES [Zea mays]|uniref:Protein SHORT INTERNODES n=1 Tax=Zea mays TaxID=4577 RepID=A0A3L6DVS5_MAIZE|nr:Protein SHORT INTERNODES [Zea mays]
MLVVAPPGSFHHQRAADDDDPVLPLVTAAQRTLVNADAASGGHGNPPVSSAGAIQFWHQEPAPDGHGSHGEKAVAMLDHASGGSGSGSGGATCQDCGNQAKKGCAHSRCRTCCNSRGFECDTHVRSTWVPAARRRERLQLAGGGGAGASPPPPTPATTKKPRLACPIPTTTAAAANSRASTSNATTPRSFDASSGHQDASFKDSLPRHVRGPAVFRCVRVTSVDDGGTNGEVAYQAAVTINGHLFRGLLYDHGAEAVMPTASDLNLGSAAPNLYNGASAPLILGGLGYTVTHTP